MSTQRKPVHRLGWTTTECTEQSGNGVLTWTSQTIACQERQTEVGHFRVRFCRFPYLPPIPWFYLPTPGEARTAGDVATTFSAESGTFSPLSWNSRKPVAYNGESTRTRRAHPVLMHLLTLRANR